MLTIIETSQFVVYAKNLWTDDERTEFINWIALNSESGDVIPGSGGCRKVRWSRAGMGKRGGARVIYFNRLSEEEIVLLIVYAKAKFDNLPAEFLKKLKEVFDA